jgi:hypothetical protein
VNAKRVVAAGAAVVVLGAGIGAAVASDGEPDPELGPVTTEVTVAKPVETTPPTVAPTVPVTLAPGFEDYTPGADLPAAPQIAADAAPDTPPPTVQGPHGPIFPDGYSEGPTPPAETPPRPSVVPGGTGSG